MHDELLPGDPAEIGGYRLSGRLGAGGMGRVYLAFTPAGRPVALKVLRPELGGDPAYRARFRQEVAAARRVSGLFTAQVLDADPDGSPPWLVTTYVAGHSLTEAVEAHGPLPESTVLLIAAGVAEALGAIHAAGLVHRDLKPSNVLLAADGPRVIDFGISRFAESPALTKAGNVVGSAHYMAPEQVRGDPVNPAADIFALGGLVSYAATGRPPFGDGDPIPTGFRVLEAQPDLAGCPPRLLELAGRCLDKDPAARPEPAQVIGFCRAQFPSGALEFTASWLPAPVAADVPRAAAPGEPGRAEAQVPAARPDDNTWLPDRPRRTGSSRLAPAASEPSPPEPRSPEPVRSEPLPDGPPAGMATAGQPARQPGRGEHPGQHRPGQHKRRQWQRHPRPRAALIAVLIACALVAAVAGYYLASLALPASS